MPFHWKKYMQNLISWKCGTPLRSNAPKGDSRACKLRYHRRSGAIFVKSSPSRPAADRDSVWRRGGSIRVPSSPRPTRAQQWRERRARTAHTNLALPCLATRHTRADQHMSCPGLLFSRGTGHIRIAQLTSTVRACLFCVAVTAQSVIHHPNAYSIYDARQKGFLINLYLFGSWFYLIREVKAYFEKKIPLRR
jgi:hypothetical protein